MPPRKKKPAYGVGAVVPVGTVLRDSFKVSWRLGKDFAQGGFGRIYTAKQVEGKSVGLEAVVKLEPSENGPLFQETHVFQRIAKPDHLDAWRKKEKLRHLGLPQYLGSGMVDLPTGRQRFLVMPCYGASLESVRAALSGAEVATLAGVLLDALRYLHTAHFVHADLKAENILLPKGSKDVSRAVLVDFGLARRLPEAPVHQPNPKKAHDGTLVFTSSDAHDGALPSYRGDVEILGYNLHLWLTGALPWETQTTPEKVAAAKTAFRKAPPPPLKAFFRLVDGLRYADRPDYAALNKAAAEAAKAGPKGRSSASPKKSLKASPRKPASDSESEEDQPPKKPSPKKPPPKKRAQAPAKKAASAKVPAKRQPKKPETESDESEADEDEADSSSGSEDEDSEEDDAPGPSRGRRGGRPKPKASPDSSSGGDTEELESSHSPPGKTPRGKAGQGRGKKARLSSDWDSSASLDRNDSIGAAVARSGRKPTQRSLANNATSRRKALASRVPKLDVSRSDSLGGGDATESCLASVLDERPAFSPARVPKALTAAKRPSPEGSGAPSGGSVGREASGTRSGPAGPRALFKEPSSPSPSPKQRRMRERNELATTANSIIPGRVGERKQNLSKAECAKLIPGLKGRGEKEAKEEEPPKDQRKKRRVKALMTESEVQTSPSLWTAKSKA